MADPRNVSAILKWSRENRPDLFPKMVAIAEHGDTTHILLMTTAFEAGRMFQATEVENPARYVPMEEEY